MKIQLQSILWMSRGKNTKTKGTAGQTIDLLSTSYVDGGATSEPSSGYGPHDIVTQKYGVLLERYRRMKL